jgi:methionyl aminopeptidase
MIEILNAGELERARAAGALVADILEAVRERSRAGVNLLEIDR